MAATLTSLFDPIALFIVLAGTLAATLVRAGWRDVALAMRTGALLAKPRFDEGANRTALARWARAIRERGVLGAEAAMPPDPDMARALKALLRAGSIKALHGAHDDTLMRRERERARGARVFELAGDLAPVFGLVGTLFSLTQLAPELGADAQGATMSALATAVLSSLYGVLTAHFLFLPLANTVARRSLREDEARVAMIEWLAREIADAVPDGRAPRLSSVPSAA